jgi:hypothetical protein
MASMPTQGLLKLIIFGGGLVLFVLLAILPARKESEALDFQIENLQNRIEEQRILTPIYENLLKKTQMEPPEGVELIEKRALKRGETGEVVDRFNRMAEENRLKLIDFSPSLETILGQSDHLEVDMILQGEFINMHPFLLELCQLPYLQQMKSFQIESEKDVRQIQLRVWLAQES